MRIEFTLPNKQQQQQPLQENQRHWEGGMVRPCSATKHIYSKEEKIGPL
jgi:hypothetical protein